MVQQHLFRWTPSPTQRYIREAENLDAADFGEPFPDLSCLLGEAFANRSTGGASGGQAHDVFEDSSVMPSGSMLRCPRCEARMRVLATITHPATIRRILEHFGVRAEPLARAPPRDPTWEQLDFDAA